MIARSADSAATAGKIAGWLLALTIALPSLIGWLPMPMRAPAPAQASAGESVDGGSSMERLLADLAVLCTPYGLRLAANGEKPVPGGKTSHDICLLCGIAAAASIGVLAGQAMAFDRPATVGIQPADVPTAPPASSSIGERPPGRGPPN